MLRGRPWKTSAARPTVLAGMWVAAAKIGPGPVFDGEPAARRAEAEAVIDELVAAAYTALDDAEAAEFAELVPTAAPAHLEP